MANIRTGPWGVTRGVRDGLPGLSGLSGYSDVIRFTDFKTSVGADAVNIVNEGDWGLRGGTGDAWAAAEQSNGYGIIVYAASDSPNDVRDRLMRIKVGSLVTAYKDRTNWADYQVGAITTQQDNRIWLWNFTLIESLGTPEFSAGDPIDLHFNPRGEPGYSIEEAFSLSATETVASLPLNTWAIGAPVAPWSLTRPQTTTSTPYCLLARRAYRGTTAISTWTAPIVIERPGSTATATGTPGQVRNLAATPGNGQMTLTWDAPASDGGSDITAYYYGVIGGGFSALSVYIGDGTSRSVTVPNLTNGTRYSFLVSALNVNGSGPTAGVSAIPSGTTPPVDPFTATLSDPTPTIGDMLHVNVVGGSGSTSRQWFRRVVADNSDVQLSTLRVYTVVVADAGNRIFCRVTRDEGTVDTALSSIIPEAPFTATLSDTTPEVGQTLSVNVVGGSGTIIYVWFRSVFGTNFEVGTGSTYTVVGVSPFGEDHDEGSRIFCRVRRNSITLDTPLSEPVPLTLPFTATLSNTTPIVGDLIRSILSPSLPPGVSLRYEWYRGNSLVDNLSTYVVVTADVGHALSCRVFLGEIFAATPASSVVPPVVVSVTLSDTTPEVGDTITCNVSGGTATYYSWFTREPGSSEATPVADGATLSTYTVQAADAGRQLTCTVIIQGQAGTTSAPWSSTIPVGVTVPTAPRNLDATVGAGQVTLTWDEPSFDGGSPILDYRYAINSGAHVIAGGPNTRSVTINLAGGVQYGFQVWARNSFGMGATAGIFATPTAITVPTAPRSAEFQGGDNGRIRLSWFPPASDGGASISFYQYRYRVGTSGNYTSAVTISGGPSARSVTLSGFTSGTFYGFQLWAVNSAGIGAAAGAFATPYFAALSDSSPTVGQNVACHVSQLPASPGNLQYFWARRINGLPVNGEAWSGVPGPADSFFTIGSELSGYQIRCDVRFDEAFEDIVSPWSSVIP